MYPELSNPRAPPKIIIRSVHKLACLKICEMISGSSPCLMRVEWKKVRMRRSLSSASFGSTCAGESRLPSPRCR